MEDDRHRPEKRLAFLRWVALVTITLSCSLITWFQSRPSQPTDSRRLVVPALTDPPQLQAIVSRRPTTAATDLDDIELEMVDGDHFLIPIDLINRIRATRGTPHLSSLAPDNTIETYVADLFGIADSERKPLNRSIQTMVKSINTKAIEGLQTFKSDGNLEYLQLPPIHDEMARALDAMLAETSLSQSKRQLFKDVFLESNLLYRGRPTRLVPNRNENGDIVSFDFLSTQTTDGEWFTHRRMGLDVLEVEDPKVARIIDQIYGDAIAVIRPYLQ